MKFILSYWHKAKDVSRFGSLFALTFATNIFLSGLGICTGIMIARFLGPEGRGELAAIQTYPQFLSIIGVLGLADAVAYFSARNPEDASRWMMTAMLIAILASSFLMATGYLIFPSLLAAQSATVVQASRIYLWYLPLNALCGIPSFALRGRNDMVAWNIHRTLPVVAWSGVILFCALVWKPNPVFIANTYLAAFAVIIIISTIILVWKRLPHSITPSTKMVRPLVSYGLPSVLSSIPSMMNLRLDQMLIAALVEPRILGLYVVGVSWSMVGAMFMATLSAVMLPHLAGISDPQQQFQSLAQLSRVGLSFTLLVSVVTMFLTPICLPLLFGKQYLESIPAALILAPAAGVASFNQLLSTGVMSLGKPKYVLIAESVGVIVTLSLLWLLLKKYQLIGAAWASLGSYLIIAAVFLSFIVQHTKVKIHDLLIPNADDWGLIKGRLHSVKVFLATK